MAIHGGCACGTVRYVLSRDELPKVYCCHCRDCQSRSESAFVEIAVVGSSELEVTGPVVTYTSRLPGGTAIENNICGECSTRILTVNSNVSDRILLLAGTLDECDAIVPVAHIWTSSKQRWVTLPADVPQWERVPTPEFLALVGYA
jgi:hypothetical protein